MKKITKATIAAGAGAALLLGSATTFAFWNSTASSKGAQLTAGYLELQPKANPKWQVKHANGTLSAADVNSLRLIPGDVLVYSGDFTIDAQGKYLDIEASVVAGGIVPANPQRPEDVALSGRLAETAALRINGASVASGQSARIQHRSDSATSYDVNISVELAWPFDNPAGSPALDNTAKRGAVSLTDFGITASQVSVQP
ncbi:alternate-type signal peptide domain-containing protein [Leucobacter luti]|uniref:alternate-type signal peptide domain-containing protein n=1 Tax=Leucobacter luti TaxID=340320 RepID=UPI003D0492B9